MLRSVSNLLALFATASAGAIKGKRVREGDGVIKQICAIDEDHTLTEKEDVNALGVMYKSAMRKFGIKIAANGSIIDKKGYDITFKRNVMAREIAACIISADDPIELVHSLFERKKRLSRYVMLSKIIREVSEGRITAATLFYKLVFRTGDQGVRDKTQEVLLDLDTEIERQCNLSPKEFLDDLLLQSTPSDVLVYLLRGKFNDVKAVQARFSELVRIGCNDDGSSVIAMRRVVGLINKLEAPECSEINKKYGFHDIMLEILTSQNSPRSVKMLDEIKLGAPKELSKHNITPGKTASASPHSVLQSFRQIPREEYDKPGNSAITRLKSYFLETEFAYERCCMLKDAPELLRTMPEEVLCSILFKIYQKETPTGKPSAEQPAEVPHQDNPADMPATENPTNAPNMEEPAEELGAAKPASDLVLPLLLNHSFEGIDLERTFKIHALAIWYDDTNFMSALNPYVMHSLRRCLNVGQASQ
ncbi:hypothetical protein PAPHI01_1609 [Pancytospora philotis]|nr:hypothetical protein PAPHI01_1609 [Pancytospora philotis]